MRIGIIGGTGREAQGLAVRWARAGHEVWIGSRDAERARTRALELSTPGFEPVRGDSNEQAAERSELAVLCVPYPAHAETLAALKPFLAGRPLIDLTVPLKPPAVTRVHVPPGTAAALEAQSLLGPETPVVAALHHISATHLADPDRQIESDVLLCADDDAAKTVAMGLIRELGMRPLDAGPLQNAVALEALTPVLLHLGRRYKTPGLGLRIVGLESHDNGSGRRGTGV